MYNSIMKFDVLLINCKVNNGIKAIGIKGNRIAYISSNKNLEKYIDEDTKVYDLKGHLVLPGFVDAHIHLLSLAKSRMWIDLKNVRSIEELKDLVRKEVKQKEKGEWVLGRGWDQEKFKEKRFPNRWDLDEVAPDNPVVLVRVCGHMCVVNSLALRIAGICKNTPSPKGGEIVKNEEGEPTGLLKESAMSLVFNKIGYDRKKLFEKYVEIIEEVLKSGITMVHLMSVSREEFEFLEKLSLEGKLKLRVRVYFDVGLLPYLEKLGIRGGFGNDFLKICGIKIILDGSLGARSAALREAYSDDKDNFGIMLMNYGELKRIIEKCKKLGLQPAVHAIGDRAIEMVLRVYEEVYRNEVKKYRPRIEHVSLLSEDLIQRIKDLKPIACVQPNFVISDWWAYERVGERIKFLYPFKTLYKITKLAIGSDSPVEPFNPFVQIYAAITRGVNEGVTTYNFTKHEVMGVHEIIKAYTEGGAYASFDENDYGNIEVGKKADLIVLDKDIFSCDAKKIKKIKIIGVMVDGKFVYYNES